jgi:hypothetical protein
VVGYDGTTGGEQALHHAIKLARNRSDVRLIVTYITSLARMTLLSAGMPGAIDQLLRQEKDIAIRLAKRAESQLDGSLVEWRFLHKCGDVVRELCTTADSLDSAGIVVGQSRALLYRVGGSVPARLARSSGQRIFIA